MLGFVALKCAVLALNTATFPTLTATRAARPTGRLGTRVSLLVPARDEERNLRRTLPGLLAQPADEILVLDDRSRDATARVVAELAGTDARVRVLSGAPLPPGWVGKTWACHQLAAAATGDVLVFCDADVTLAPGALRSLLAEAEHQQADVFSVFPRQATETLAERLIVPLIDDVLLCFLPHGLLRRPIPAAATANGQLLAFHRAAYDKLDGNRGVRAAIVEDVRLARQARRLGLRLGLALGGDMVCARMYEGYRSTVAGFGKSLLAAHGGSGPVLAGGAGWHLLAYTAPWFRLGRDPVWTAAAVLGVLERILLNAKTGRRAWWEAALVPATPVAALPLYARALLLPPIWKGRTYA
ncbi:MAG: glycosyltransferase family 2 protein [Jiangellaceae bacterium]